MLSQFSKIAFKRHSSFQVFRQFLHVENWYESEIITEKKSKFQGRSATLQETQEISHILHQFLAEHKNIAKSASHPHMIAWRTGSEIPSSSSTNTKSKKQFVNSSPCIKYTNIDQGFKDNGEKGAGSKLLDLLVKNDLMNVMVIVTRWYGGNPIGSRRFRCITSCALDSLRKAKRI